MIKFFKKIFNFKNKQKIPVHTCKTCGHATKNSSIQGHYRCDCKFFNQPKYGYFVGQQEVVLTEKGWEPLIDKVIGVVCATRKEFKNIAFNKKFEMLKTGSALNGRIMYMHLNTLKSALSYYVHGYEIWGRPFEGMDELVNGIKGGVLAQNV